MTWDILTLRAARLQTRHIHPYFDVARETVSGWMNERHEPAGRFAPIVDRLQRAVQIALLEGALPVSRRADLSQAEYDLRVGRVLQRYVQREEDADLSTDN